MVDRLRVMTLSVVAAAAEVDATTGAAAALRTPGLRPTFLVDPTLDALVNDVRGILEGRPRGTAAAANLPRGADEDDAAALAATVDARRDLMGRPALTSCVLSSVASMIESVLSTSFLLMDDRVRGRLAAIVALTAAGFTISSLPIGLEPACLPPMAKTLLTLFDWSASAVRLRPSTGAAVALAVCAES